MLCFFIRADTMNRAELVKQKELFISVVVPIYNEESNIIDFVTALSATLRDLSNRYEILLIDDGSQDKSLDLIEANLLSDTSVKLISFSRNFGKEAALTAGLDHCQGKVCIIIDADFQQPIETLTNFIDQWQAGYDMVYAIRKDRLDETWIKRSLTRVFYRLIDYLSATKIPPNASDFRLLDRKVIDALNRCGETNRFLKGLYAWVGFKSTAIYYQPQERNAGKTSFSFKRLFSLALTGILSFSDVPLRALSIVGMLVSGISFLYALLILFKTLFFGVDVPGFATLAVAIIFFGGVQLFSIGILGEYIARIFSEVKCRPKYLIDRTIGLDN